MSNYIPVFYMDIITYPCWSLLSKEAQLSAVIVICNWLTKDKSVRNGDSYMTAPEYNWIHGISIELDVTFHMHV